MFIPTIPYGGPQRGLVKPLGVPRIIPHLAPRGLMYCFPFADPSFKEIYTGLVTATRGTTQKFSPSPFGMSGAFALNATSWLAYAIPAWTITQPMSVEMIVWITATGYTTDSDDLWNIVNSTTPTSATSYPLGMTADTSTSIYGFNGGGFAPGATVSAGSYLHYTMTWDGSTVRSYQNGVALGSAGASSPSGTGSAIIFGIASNGDQSIPGNYLLCNVANVVWTPQEILQRYLNPYGFLSFPGDFASSLTAAVISGGSSTSVNLVAAAATAAIEALVPNVQPTLIATAGTAVSEALIANVQSALSSVEATAGIEALTPNVGPTPSGAAATGAVAAIGMLVEPTLAAGAATTAVEALAPTIQQALAAAAATGNAQAIVPQVSVTLSAGTASGAAGTITVIAGITVNLVGVSATGGAASLTPNVEPVLISATASGAFNTLTPSVEAFLNAASSSGAVEALAVNISAAVALAAAAAAAGEGSFSPLLDIPLSGGAATGAAAAVTASIAKLIQLAAATAGEGALTVEIEVNLMGAQASGNARSFVFSQAAGVALVLKGNLVTLQNLMSRGLLN